MEYQLLQLRRGWKPTATGTVDGDEILGHAACVVPEATDTPYVDKLLQHLSRLADELKMSVGAWKANLSHFSFVDVA